MQSPPPFHGSAPKKKNTGLIIGLIIGGVLLCCIFPVVGLGGLGLWGFNKVKSVAGCAISVGDMGKALTKYLAEHDNTFPKADTWQDELRPYYAKEWATTKKDLPFSLVGPEGSWHCTDSEGPGTGFAFNSELAGKKRSEANANVVAIFELPEVKSNFSAPYKKLDRNSSPKVMGDHRDWFVIYGNGESNGGDFRKGSIKVNSNQSVGKRIQSEDSAK